MNKEKVSGISVDSLKIRIPIERVKIIDRLLSTQNIIVINGDTGEEIDIEGYDSEFKIRARKIQENGIKTRFAIEKQQTSFKTTAEYLVILFNAKLLKERYFEGITSANIDLIYERLIEYKIASFSFSAFLAGECTDVDFKKDITYKSDFIKLIDALYGQTIESRDSGKGARTFKEKKNKGIQFANRNTTKFIRNPYLKVYHKGIEFEYHSVEFMNAYFPVNNYGREYKVRIETTVKNKDHFRALFGQDVSTELKSILMLSTEQKEKIFKVAANSHFRPLLKQQKTITGKKPNDIFILRLINMHMENGLSFEFIKNILLNDISDRHVKSRKKTDLDNLYSEFIKGTKEDKTTKEIQQFFDALGMI